MHLRHALVIAALTLTAACGGSSESKSAAPTSGAPSTAPPTTARRSQPYWAAVVDLSGSGATTAKPFTIDPVALQWRMTFHCQTGTFSATGVRGTEPLRRPLAANAPCGPQAEGSAFSGELGTITVSVTATGPWDAKVEQQVDGPLVEPVTPALASAQVVAVGQFTKLDREGEGTVKVYRLPNGRQAVRLESFYTSINPDLGLMLSSLAAPKTSAELQAAPSTEIALLKATYGSMNYEVPPDVDATTYQSVAIWSERAKSAFTVAVLHAP